MKLVFVILSLLVLQSCQVEPQAINYGKDQCNFCKMNIVDRQHAAQYVTKKGKQFKFDAIECMVDEVLVKGEDDLAILLVSNYGKSTMIDAKTATFLISPEIKSPMGAFLSAFSDKKEAIETQKEYTGDLYTWEELKIQLVRK